MNKEFDIEKGFYPDRVFTGLKGLHEIAYSQKSMRVLYSKCFLFVGSREVVHYQYLVGAYLKRVPKALNKDHLKELIAQIINVNIKNEIGS